MIAKDDQNSANTTNCEVATILEERKNMKKIEGIIFDLDGTLWSTIDSCEKVLREVQARHPEVTRDIIREEIEKSMGKPFDEIVKTYYGYIEHEKAVVIAKEAFEENVKNLMINGGTLYDGLYEVIVNLSKKYKLFIVSNCIDGYIESFLKMSNLSKYFQDYECNGRTKLSKGENIKLVMERNNIEQAVYVGDTMKDKEAAEFAKIPFVYASYGFGQVDQFDYKIDDIKDLCDKLF
jgi:phosphoglycolate phosphatase